MVAGNRNGIEQDCSRLLIGFYAALDDRRYDDVAAAFAETGVWVRMGEALNGAAEIRKGLEGRFPDALVVHGLTNLHFPEVEETRARSRTQVLVYAGKMGADGAPGEGALRALTVAETEYVLTPAGWRIAHHNGRPLMMIP